MVLVQLRGGPHHTPHILYSTCLYPQRGARRAPRWWLLVRRRSARPRLSATTTTNDSGQAASTTYSVSALLYLLYSVQCVWVPPSHGAPNVVLLRGRPADACCALVFFKFRGCNSQSLLRTVWCIYMYGAYDDFILSLLLEQGGSLTRVVFFFSGRRPRPVPGGSTAHRRPGGGCVYLLAVLLSYGYTTANDWNDINLLTLR